MRVVCEGSNQRPEKDERNRRDVTQARKWCTSCQKWVGVRFDGKLRQHGRTIDVAQQ